MSRILILVSILALTAAAQSSTVPLRITEVNTFTGSVEVTNISTSPFTTAANLPFSHESNTSSFIASGTTFAAGESKTTTVTSLTTADSDLWLYEDTNFASSSSIISGLKWGPASNVGRTSVAVAASLWPSTSAFVGTQGSSANSLRLKAFDGTKTTSWIEATPNFGSFFGTGTLITNNDLATTITVGSLGVSLQLVASNFSSPLGVVAPDDGTDRMFVYDETGTVTLILAGVVQPTYFLNVASTLNPLSFGYDERGLLGFACHPNFASTKKVYTYTTEPPGSGTADYSPLVAATVDHQNVIAEWQVDSGNPNIINPSTRRELLRINHPALNHDGGTLRFGKDGMLYISLGDGGTADDQGNGHLVPTGNAQRTDTIFGKILRIDPDGNNSTNGKYGIPPDNPFASGVGGLKEIWAYGLRNPYAYSFDRQTGAMWCGDAGQNAVEEVDVITTGANCGWNFKEGSFFFDPRSSAQNGFPTTIPTQPIPNGLLEPITNYDHDDGGVVVGGFVYRGTSLTGYQGMYICADWGKFGFPNSGRLFYLDPFNTLKEFRGGPVGAFIKGFGEDRNGEMYLCTSNAQGPIGTSGKVWKLVQLAPVEDWNKY